MNPTRQGIGLMVLIAVSLGAGAIGSWFNSPSVKVWYPTLLKPSWTPPNWVFAPVWTVLYLAMAVAAWLVWRRAGFSGAKAALVLFAIQLVLNVAWSGVFFALRRPGLAFAEIVLLWCAILATTIKFWPASRLAGWLMVPYLAWVTYAAALNCAIWRLNA